ncbi:Alpha/beta hydrolase fold-3 [Penicillium riverlandense]|uniref:Alpha/beta hydrolase fold-3 n=1 Tax=Penicillium riverlandense TaxID=1903569 RepID=UPI002547C755|nr:Alpha/beta hydrolase fold-3 [Penicillium riverlandense]KAJ5825644.1 Alpha/beta hydrolase fold-3 [Penicillium riverlandense]
MIPRGERRRESECNTEIYDFTVVLTISCLKKLPKSLRDDEIHNIDMAHPFLSLRPTHPSLLLASYPPAVATYICGWEQWFVEGNTFRDRLAELVAEGQLNYVWMVVVEDEIHAFDKTPDVRECNSGVG